MTTTPLPPLPTTVAAARYTAEQMFDYSRKARADLEAEVARLREALQNMLGAFDTPIQRRRLGRSSIADKAIESARAALESKT